MRKRSRYASDNLTTSWFDRHPSPYAWWATNPRPQEYGGVSYCIVNAQHPEHVDAIKKELIARTRYKPYEILTFTENAKMKDLFEFCKYTWVQRIDDCVPKTRADYNPKISIVMSTFKRQHCILRTVGYVLAQDYQNWELIIVDNEKDGPGLPTMPDDPRISTINLTAEANGCYSRNEGVKLATGDLVCYFDDDDEMLPGFLRKMSAPFCDPEVQVVSCGMLLTEGLCDFSYSTQEAWLRREYATPTWVKGTPFHDQIYFHSVIDKNKWTRRNIIQLGEVLVIAHTEPIGGRRTPGAED